MTHTTDQALPTADVARDLNDLVAGAGILTMALFPLAVPVLVLVLAPLALAGAAVALLAAPLVLPVWLARRVRRRRRSARGPWVGDPAAAPTAAYASHPGTCA